MREQAASGFARILADLIERVPGAYAAAIVDSEGETVDYAGDTDAFGIRVAAAHLQLVLGQASPPEARARWIWVRTTRGALSIHALPEGYAVAILFSYRSRPPGRSRALLAMESEVIRECGWSSGKASRWHAVDVVCEGGLPSAVKVPHGVEVLEIIGRFEDGLAWRERGWRVRFASGIEAMLVREPGGHWYADELIPGAGGSWKEARGALLKERAERR